MPGRIEGPPPPLVPQVPEPPPKKPADGDDGATTKTFLGMPMTEEQFKQAWNSLMNDIGREINHYTQRALDALKELKKSLTGEEDS